MKINRSKKQVEAKRCGHFEQVKVGPNWKCVACGKILTVSESIQNSMELSDVMKSASDSRRTLSESLDEVFGRKEWEEIREKIPQSNKRHKKAQRRNVDC
jgi:hypothetical protein